jgi:hypothetical protein
MWGTCMPAVLVVTILSYLPQAQKCVTRKTCCHWYQSSKLPYAQKILWQYPLRMAFQRIYETHQKHCLSMSLNGKTIYLSNGSPTVKVATQNRLKLLEFNEIQQEPRERTRDSRVWGTAADDASNLVAYQRADCIEIMEKNSIKTTLDYKWAECYGLAFHNSQLFVAFCNCVKVYDMDGKVVQAWELPFLIRNFRASPRKLCIFGDRLYMAESADHCIQVYSLTGTPMVQWGVKGSKPGEFYDIRGIAVNSTGVYVVDDRNQRVQVFTHQGVFVCQSKLSCLYVLGDIVFLDNSLYIQDRNSDKIGEFIVHFEGGQMCK